jgi:hypothetical protein
MRKTIHVALAAATIASAAVFAARSLAAPAEQSGLAGRGALVREAAVICAGNGCAPVQTKQIKHKNKLPQHI